MRVLVIPTDVLVISQAFGMITEDLNYAAIGNALAVAMPPIYHYGFRPVSVDGGRSSPHARTVAMVDRSDQAIPESRPTKTQVAGRAE